MVGSNHALCALLLMPPTLLVLLPSASAATVVLGHDAGAAGWLTLRKHNGRGKEPMLHELDNYSSYRFGYTRLRGEAHRGNV